MERTHLALLDYVPEAVTRFARYLWAVFWRFERDECLMRASGLAYVTLLSIVPLLALMFAVLKGLGAQHRLEPLLLSRFALDPETTDRIIGYIDQTNVGTLGALGAAALILTVVSVLGTVEANLNFIWRVPRGRNYWRKLTDYSAVVLLTPLLLLAAVALTSSLQEQAMLQRLLNSEFVGPAALAVLRLLPAFINAIALFVLYVVMTNRRPYWPGVAVGALVAGVLWHAVQWAYIAFQIGMARYNAIYGALSQLPITLVWLYLSALIVLAGAELAAVYELGSDTEFPATGPTPWLIGVHLLVRAADQFQGKGGPVDLRSVAEELHVDLACVTTQAAQLEDDGYLLPVADHDSSYVLARDPNTILLDPLDAASAAALLSGCDPRVTAAAAQLVRRPKGTREPLHLSDILGHPDEVSKADPLAGTVATQRDAHEERSRH